MHESNPFHLFQWRLDPPQRLLEDPGYRENFARRQRSLILLVTALVIVFNPLFWLALTRVPDVPRESIVLRVLPMIVAIIFLPIHWRQRSDRQTRFALVSLLIVQLCCSLSQVVESGNSPIYAMACMTPLYACQFIFDRLKDLLFALLVSLSWYLFYFSLHTHGVEAIDYAVLFIFLSGGFITASFGAIRIKDMEQLELSKLELAQKSFALEQAELSARHAATTAQEANAAKSRFLANMSHELRTPLNAIIGYAELLLEVVEDRDDLEELHDDLDRINSSGTHLLRLISEILDLSKVEAGQMECVPEEIDFKAFIREIDEMGRSLASTNNNRFSCHCDTPLPSSIYTDGVKLRQILLNLLSNAAKFTERGAIDLDIACSAEGVLSFAVHDTGMGMNEEQLAKLFQPFSQVHDKMERERYGGTGLGLMLSKRLCTLLHGSIKVESKIKQGTSFTVHIPARHDASGQA